MPAGAHAVAAVQCSPAQANRLRLGGWAALRSADLTLVPRRNSRSGMPVVLDGCSLAGAAALESLAVTSDGGVRLSIQVNEAALLTVQT